MDRIWSGIPDQPVDAVGALWEWRAEEAEALTRKASTPVADDASDETGETALRRLGIS